MKLGANRRLVGEDVRAGAMAIPAGRRLKPQDVALVASLGIEKIRVRRRVRVALFSTGDEIVEPGKPLAPAALYDANRYLLLGLLDRLGAATDDLGIFADDPEILGQAIDQAARGHDLVLTTGGVSTGEADHVKTAVERLGRLVFWRIGIKPGRPVAMGVVRGAAFTGLPGNPVAVFVTFAYIVRPLLLRLAGALPEPLIALPVRAAFAYKKKKARREYVRVALRRAADGTLEAVEASAGGRGRDHLAHRDRRFSGITGGDDRDRAGDDGRIFVVSIPDQLKFGGSGIGVARGDFLGLRQILRRVDVEERIERPVRPGGERDAMAASPRLDLMQAVDGERAAQIVAERNRPQTRDRMPPLARARAGERLFFRDPRRVQARHEVVAAKKGNRRGRSRAIRSSARFAPPNRGRRECRQAAPRNPERCRRRPAIRSAKIAPDRHGR